MNTLEMAIELRKNPKLKAMCVVGDVMWKVKCGNGSLMWEDENRSPKFLDMSDFILKHNNWNIYSEEKKPVEVLGSSCVTLEKGIGVLPNDKKIIGDIYVRTSDNTMHTIRPIGKTFAVPTDDIKVFVYYNYECMGTILKYCINNQYKI